MAAEKAMDLHQSSSVGEDEFHFWSSNRKFKNHHGDGELGSYSQSDKFQETLSFSSSPLLLWNHHYSNGSLSPSSRTRQIEQGRKELMEVIHTLPETSFEFSLKDIVDDVKNLDEATEDQKKNAKNVPSKELMEIIRTLPDTIFELSLKDIVDDVKNLDEATEEPKKNANNVPSNVLSCSNMDNGDSLIKMFLPSCLSFSKKKLKKDKNLGLFVVSPRTSVNAEEKDSWIKKSQELGNKSCRSSRWRICRFCSSCRKASVESSPQCWPFGMVKSRVRR